MGAYTLSGAVAFNGIPLARCIYVVSQSWETIKDAFNDSAIVDEQMVINLMKEANSSTCAAAATLALARALSAKHELLSSDLHDDHDSAIGLVVSETDLISADDNSLDKSTVDCAITC